MISLPNTALPVLVAANLAVAYVAIEYNLSALHEENALLENFQAVLLALSAVWFSLRRVPDPVDRLRERALAALCFSFVLREVDIDGLDVPVLLQTLGSGYGRLILLVLVWGLVVRSLWSLRHAGLWRRFLDGQALVTLGATLLLLLVGAAMDRNLLGLQHFQLWEELAETNAYVLLVVGHMSRDLHPWGARNVQARA